MAQFFRLAYGLALASLLFIPFGVYHSTSEPYITGLLYGFHLPTGYIGLLLGITMVLYPKFAKVKNLRFETLLLLAGFFILLSLFFPSEYFINVLNKTSFNSSQIDIDYPVGNLAVWGLSILSLSLWLGLKIRKLIAKNRKQNAKEISV